MFTLVFVGISEVAEVTGKRCGRTGHRSNVLTDVDRVVIMLTRKRIAGSPVTISFAGYRIIIVLVIGVVMIIAVMMRMTNSLPKTASSTTQRRVLSLI